MRSPTSRGRLVAYWLVMLPNIRAVPRGATVDGTPVQEVGSVGADAPMLPRVGNAGIEEPIARIVGDYLVAARKSEILSDRTLEVAVNRITNMLCGAQWLLWSHIVSSPVSRFQKADPL